MMLQYSNGRKSQRVVDVKISPLQEISLHVRIGAKKDGIGRPRFLASLMLRVSFFPVIFVFELRVLFTFLPMSQRAPRSPELEAVGATLGTS